jgi:hypothetical protein
VGDRSSTEMLPMPQANPHHGSVPTTAMIAPTAVEMSCVHALTIEP